MNALDTLNVFKIRSNTESRFLFTKKHIKLNKMECCDTLTKKPISGSKVKSFLSRLSTSTKSSGSIFSRLSGTGGDTGDCYENENVKLFFEKLGDNPAMEYKVNRLRSGFASLQSSGGYTSSYRDLAKVLLLELDDDEQDSLSNIFESDPCIKKDFKRIKKDQAQLILFFEKVLDALVKKALCENAQHFKEQHRLWDSTTTACIKQGKEAFDRKLNSNRLASSRYTDLTQTASNGNEESIYDSDTNAGLGYGTYLIATYGAEWLPRIDPNYNSK